MPEIYVTGANGLWIFLALTVVLGGAAAWATGNAMAATWRPAATLIVYIFGLAAAVRFFHFALFAEPLLAPGNYVIDLAVLLAVGLAGYRVRRARQMATQYAWLDRAPSAD
jgi:hypothetical protein